MSQLLLPVKKSLGIWSTIATQFVEHADGKSPSWCFDLKLEMHSTLHQMTKYGHPVWYRWYSVCSRHRGCTRIRPISQRSNLETNLKGGSKGRWSCPLHAFKAPRGDKTTLAALHGGRSSGSLPRAGPQTWPWSNWVSEFKWWLVMQRAAGSWSFFVDQISL